MNADTYLEDVHDAMSETHVDIESHEVPKSEPVSKPLDKSLKKVPPKNV